MPDSGWRQIAVLYNPGNANHQRFEMTDIAPELELYTTGHLSQMFQEPVGRVVKILIDAGVPPAMLINGTMHFSSRAVDVLREKLSRQKK